MRLLCHSRYKHKDQKMILIIKMFLEEITRTARRYDDEESSKALPRRLRRVGRWSNCNHLSSIGV